jgi:hypothetical protein
MRLSPFHNEDPKLGLFTQFCHRVQSEIRNYYTHFFTQWFPIDSFPDYLQRAAEQFAREETLLHQILPSNELQEALTIVYKAFCLPVKVNSLKKRKIQHQL